MYRALHLTLAAALCLAACLTSAAPDTRSAAPTQPPPPAPQAEAPALRQPRPDAPWEGQFFYPVCADTAAERRAMLQCLRDLITALPAAVADKPTAGLPTDSARAFASGALRAQAIPDPTPAPPTPPALKPGPSGQEQLLVFVPVAATLFTALLKTLITRLPGWSLPILCTSLGVLATWLTTGSLTQQSALVGAVLGGAGVAVREVVDQLRQRLATTPPGGGVTRAGATYAFAALLIVLAGLGCANVGNRAKDITETITEKPNGEITTVTRTREVESTVHAVGDAKQAVQAMSARNTATTQSIGTEGVTQESTLAGVIQLIQAIFEAGKSAGASGAKGGL